MIWRRPVSLVTAAQSLASPVGLRFSSTSQPSQSISERQQQLHHVCDAIYRSSTAREALRQAIHEPSHENALRLLQEFEKDSGVWRDRAWADAFQSASSRLSSQMRLVFLRFAQWHTVRKAPTKVGMHTPWDWYPQARLMRRRFIFHHGPTNSGKTHTALEALVRARSGVYCAPLKALAAQVCHRMKGRVPCDLLIGDERVFGGAAEHVSCTVEMAPVDVPVDAAVIDEIHMIADRDRGWAWTRALFGLPAREIHLCGEARALSLIQSLLYATHERKYLTVVEHKRLVPLVVSPSLRSRLRPDTVENGDCFVCFSKRQVLNLRARLNSLPGVASSAIYGAMPFQVREAEAARFNRGAAEYIAAATACDADKNKRVASFSARSHRDAPPCRLSPTSAKPPRHVLVATDAIAYGLNMNIERIVFTAMHKFDGYSMSELPAAMVQQIAGRSGRFGAARQRATGLCTVLHERDMKAFDATMSAQLAPIEKAGLLPTSDILQLFIELERAKTNKDGEGESDLNGRSFFELVSKFASSCSTSSLFFPCDIHRSLLRLAELLEPVPDLSLMDRILFCYLPLSDTSTVSLELIRAYATDHAAGKPVSLRFDVFCAELVRQAELGAVSDEGGALQQSRQQPRSSTELIMELERCFRQAEMYCWLSWRFGKTFVERERGLELKTLISAALMRLSGSV